MLEFDGPLLELYAICFEVDLFKICYTSLTYMTKKWLKDLTVYDCSLHHKLNATKGIAVFIQQAIPSVAALGGSSEGGKMLYYRFMVVSPHIGFLCRWYRCPFYINVIPDNSIMERPDDTIHHVDGGNLAGSQH